MGDSREEENADQSDVTCRGHRTTLNWWLDTDVKADVEHGATLGDTGPQETLPPAEGICGKKKEACTSHHFDYAVDTYQDEKLA